MYLIRYTLFMIYVIKQSDKFSKWLMKLKDLRGKIAIARSVERMRNGNFGDVKPVGENVAELKIDTGHGYRVYFTKKDSEIVIILIGGDKSTQQSDIEKATVLAKEYLK